MACLASSRALFTQQDRFQRIPEAKRISGRAPLQGNRAESSVALGFMETTSTIISSMNTLSPHLKQDTSSDTKLKIPSKGVLVQRDIDVVSNVKSPDDVV